MSMPKSMSLPRTKRHDAVYARYSSHKQDSSTSIEVQLDQAHRHPEIDPDALDYVDRARTGRALGKRVEFKRLRADIAAKRIKRVFVYMYDRLSRSTKLHEIVEEIENLGCEVISCTEGRIISDVEFETVQKLIEGRSRPRGAARAVNGVRPFTGHLFCKECGSVCYSGKSENSKGTYHYYNCGCRQRKGPKACPNAGSIREDRLADLISSICTDLLADADAVIDGAIKIGLKHLDAGRIEAGRIQREIADLDAQHRSLMALMMNPAIDAGTLTAFSRQIAEKESERKKMEGRMGQIGASAAQGQERLGQAIRTAYRRVCENLKLITSDSHMNRFVEEQIGPMLLTSEGVAVPRGLENTAASALAEAAVNISVGGSEPCSELRKAGRETSAARQGFVLVWATPGLWAASVPWP
ncbi:MAG: recombinase family protein [Phycisphaerales bacterium]|nr:recombinase family protein [Phycisphaerales bacterium]